MVYDLVNKYLKGEYLMQDWINISIGGGSAILTWIVARILVANYKRNKEIKRQIKEDQERKESRKQRRKKK